jgi:hypothetical protein
MARWRTHPTHLPMEKTPGAMVLLISFAVMFVVLTILGFMLAAQYMP